MSNTFVATPKFITKKWWIIDASGIPLGRLASRVAMILRGKHKPYYTANINCGDHVIIINSSRILITGKKLQQKTFFWHTGHPGGIKERTWGKILSGKFPERLVKKAVERMMPKDSPLADNQMKALHIFSGEEHTHHGQQPQSISYDKI